jgi:hypothetical protein
MDRRQLRPIQDLAAAPGDLEAQIEIFGMHEVALVEAAELAEAGGAHEHERARDRRDGTRPPRGFGGVEVEPLEAGVVGREPPQAERFRERRPRRQDGARRTALGCAVRPDQARRGGPRADPGTIRSRLGQTCTLTLRNLFYFYRNCVNNTIIL